MPSSAFDLAWLASAINAGLSTELSTHRLDGLTGMTFGFRSFSSGDDINLAAAEIVGGSVHHVTQ